MQALFSIFPHNFHPSPPRCTSLMSVGADAERSCSRRRSVTDALDIGPYKIYRRFSDFHTPQVQSKALVDRRGPGKPSERFPRSLFSFARRFLFGEAKRKCRPFPLFPKRERKEWVQKRVQPQFAALQKSPFFFLGTRHSGAGPSTRMISSPIRRMQHHGTT